MCFIRSVWRMVERLQNPPPLTFSLINAVIGQLSEGEKGTRLWTSLSGSLFLYSMWLFLLLFMWTKYHTMKTLQMRRSENLHHYPRTWTISQYPINLWRLVFHSSPCSWNFVLLNYVAQTHFIVQIHVYVCIAWSKTGQCRPKNGTS